MMRARDERAGSRPAAIAAAAVLSCVLPGFLLPCRADHLPLLQLLLVVEPAGRATLPPPAHALHNDEDALQGGDGSGPAAHAETGPADDPLSAPAPFWVAVPGEPEARVSLEKGRDLVLLAQARGADSFATLAARFTARETPPSVLAEANPGRPTVRQGAWYRIPLALLGAVWRARALRAAFPADGPSPAGWVHRPFASPLDTYGEGAWQTALWFTGDGANFEAIQRANGLADPVLKRSEQIVIPVRLLLEPLRSSCAPAPAESTPVARTLERGPRRGSSQGAAAHAHGSAADADEDADEDAEDAEAEELEEPQEQGDTSAEAPAPSRAAPGKGNSQAAAPPPMAAAGAPSPLTFSKDERGEYASYRLEPGEALYSAVVVRFTGRIDPDEVSEASALIAERSGIRDPTSIPAGFSVKIPHSLLLPEFLPTNDRKRRAADAAGVQAARVRNPVRSRNLRGIHVILDAGHGGVDPGALIAGVAEHEYVYDVMCRAKRILETETAATVHPVIEDPASGFAPKDGSLLRAGGREAILTTPAHVNGDPSETSLGVNLRWYVANALARRLARSGVDPTRTVFASFHADVLHPSLRGAMVYVPGERYRSGSYSCQDPECSRYREVREAPVVHFSKAERVASEGLSRQLAAQLVAAFTNLGIRVHPYQPVRDRIIRHGRAWLPAVLKGNRVPAKVLVEMANLNNREDRALIQRATFRESVARAFVDALLAYYGAEPARPAKGTRVASRRPRP